jgi:RNA polymerase sigma factor (sigma-70 family)
MHDTAQTSDANLLAEYVRGGDESAFAALVTLHERMVIGTAWRRTGDAELARDIAQEVFATLARKAAWLTGRSTIAGWLYTTTVHVASRARQSETARRLREQRYSAGAYSGSNDRPWQLLEDALRELPSADREAVVLHFLEDRSYEDMARTLGLSEIAIRKRVSRALKTLGVRLRRRGFASTAASLLTGAVAAQVTVPATVSAQAALAVATSGGGSSVLIAISTIMSHTTIKLAAAAILVLAAPIAWQSQANSEKRAELAAIQARNTTVASTFSELRANDNAALQRVLDTTTAQLRDAQSNRQKAESELAALRQKADQLQQEVLVSFGKSEDIARQVAAKIGPLVKLEAIKKELKKNPNDPRLSELARELAQNTTDLMMLSAQIAMLEDDPVQYARFKSVLYGELLGLDVATRSRLEAILLPAFEKLRRDGLTLRNRPQDQDQAEDWARRRDEAEQLIWQQVERMPPPAAISHPLISKDDLDLALQFTSWRALDNMLPKLGKENPMPLRANPPTLPPSSKQP